MHNNTLFIGIFFAAQIVAIVFVGVIDFMGVVLAAAFGTLAAALISKRQKTTRLEGRERIQETFLCSGVMAILFAVIYITKVYLILLVMDITGSPFDVPGVNLFKGFFRCWFIVFTSVSCVIFLFDSYALKAPPPEPE